MLMKRTSSSRDSLKGEAEERSRVSRLGGKGEGEGAAREVPASTGPRAQRTAWWRKPGQGGTYWGSVSSEGEHDEDQQAATRSGDNRGAQKQAGKGRVRQAVCTRSALGEKAK